MMTKAERQALEL